MKDCLGFIRQTLQMMRKVSNMSSDLSSDDFQIVEKCGTINMNEVQLLLPEDLVIEILSWLPVKPVVRCKCVCKLWQSIIDDTKFIRKHMFRLKSIILGSSCENSSFKYIYNIDGLHLEFCDNNKIYRIRNATNQFLILPDPEMNRCFMSMGYVPSTNEYKVLYLYWKGVTGGIGMKLLTIGHQNIWRSIEIPFSNFRKLIRPTTKPLDVASYILYSCSLGKAKLLRFQFDDESFTEILTPTKDMPHTTTNVKKLKFLTWDNKTSIGWFVAKIFYVWILVDFKKSKWEERKIVFPSKFLQQHHDMFENFDPDYVKGCWLRLLFDNRKKCLCYNIETKKSVKVTNNYFVRDSIVRLEGMQ